MEKDRETIRVELVEEQRPEQAKDQEPKAHSKDLEVSELEPRIAPVQVGTFF